MCGAYMADRIIGLLRPHGVVLTGGVIWAGLVSDAWLPKDIDLFIVHEQLGAVAEALGMLGWKLEQAPSQYDSQLPAPALSSWKSAIWFVRCYSYGEIKMDVVVVAHGISEALARFDLRACASNFDGRKVEVVNPCRTLVRKTRVCSRRLALINDFAVSVATAASQKASCYLSRRVWFAGLDAGVQAVQSAGFDPVGFRDLMDALRSDDISLRLCGSVCQLACLTELACFISSQ